MSSSSFSPGEVLPLVDVGELAPAVVEGRRRERGRAVEHLRDLAARVLVARIADGVLAQELVAPPRVVVRVHAEERHLACRASPPSAGSPGTPRGTGRTTTPTCSRPPGSPRSSRERAPRTHPGRRRAACSPARGSRRAARARPSSWATCSAAPGAALFGSSDPSSPPPACEQADGEHGDDARRRRSRARRASRLIGCQTRVHPYEGRYIRSGAVDWTHRPVAQGPDPRRPGALPRRRPKGTHGMFAPWPAAPHPPRVSKRFSSFT